MKNPIVNRVVLRSWCIAWQILVVIYPPSIETRDEKQKKLRKHLFDSTRCQKAIGIVSVRQKTEDMQLFNLVLWTRGKRTGDDIFKCIFGLNRLFCGMVINIHTTREFRHLLMSPMLSLNSPALFPTLPISSWRLLSVFTSTDYKCFIHSLSLLSTRARPRKPHGRFSSKAHEFVIASDSIRRLAGWFDEAASHTLPDEEQPRRTAFTATQSLRTAENERFWGQTFCLLLYAWNLWTMDMKIKKTGTLDVSCMQFMDNSGIIREKREELEKNACSPFHNLTTDSEDHLEVTA